jgi:hypothetical protein
MCLFSGRGGIDLEYTYVEFHTNTKKNTNEIELGNLTHIGDQVAVMGTMILLQSGAH